MVASIVWERDDIGKVKKSTRCLKVVSPEMMCEELSFNLNGNTTIDELVKCYETECVRCMDKLAPTKTKIVVERKLNPWHNDDTKEQKRRVHSVYASAMKDLVPQSINIHGYADDHAVKKRFSPDCFRGVWYRGRDRELCGQDQDMDGQ